MRKQQGYSVISYADGSIKEQDTFTCSHCNNVFFIAPRVEVPDLGGFCRMCMKTICGPCVDEGSCVPFERKLDQLGR